MADLEMSEVPTMPEALTMPAVLTMSQARVTLTRLEGELPAAKAAAAASISAPVVVDASALQTLDSAALAVLLQCRRRALQAGRAFQVTGAAPKLRQLAQLYGVDGLLELA